LSEYYELRNRIGIYSKTLIPDGHGGNTESWNLFLSAWADVDSLVDARSKNIQMAWEWMQSHPEVSYRITIRYRAGVVHGMRVLYKSKYFEIVGINNLDERDRYLILFVKEVNI